MRPLKQGRLSFAQHVFVRNSIYYYRADIPTDLNHYFQSTEIKQSLKTKDSKVAKVMTISLITKRTAYHHTSPNAQLIRPPTIMLIDC
jgi:uncharacterized protein DUF6538